MDPAAIEAGLDVVKAIGRGNARLLLEVLELPDDERLAFISSMYQRRDGQALAEGAGNRGVRAVLE